MSDHTNVMEAIAGIVRLSTDLMPVDAIWLEKPLQMEGKCSMRIAVGDKVMVRAANLVDLYPHQQPNYEIIECRGNLYNTLFEVDLKDLKTGDLLTIKL